MNDDLRMLVLVTGEEGVGKSTVMEELLASTPGAAKLDAEDVGQVNPFEFGAEFLDLLWRNVVAVLDNFWSAGYNPIFTGSLLDGIPSRASPASEHWYPKTFMSRSFTCARRRLFATNGELIVRSRRALGGGIVWTPATRTVTHP